MAEGISSRVLLQEHWLLRKKFWGRHLWARGYLAVSSGTITDEMIREYSLAPELTQEPIEGGRSCQVSRAAGEPELAIAKSGGEEAEKLASEHWQVYLNRREMLRARPAVVPAGFETDRSQIRFLMIAVLQAVLQFVEIGMFAELLVAVPILIDRETLAPVGTFEGIVTFT